MPPRKSKSKPSSPALNHLYERYIEGDPKREAYYQEHLIKAEIGHNRRKKIDVARDDSER